MAVLSFQSLIFSIYLLTLRTGKSTSNRWLATFLILLGAHMVINIVERSGTILTLPYLMVISASYGPVLYMYISSLQRQKPIDTVVVALHFIPSVLVLMIIHFLPEKSIMLLGIGVMIQILSYLIAAYFSVRNYQNVLRETQSRFDSISLEWCNRIIVFFALIIIVDVLNSVFMGTTNIFFLLLILGFLVLVNGLLFKALHEPTIFVGITTEEEDLLGEKRAKYKNSKLSDSEIDILARDIEHYYVNERPFLKSDFNLAQLSEELSRNSREISQAINTSFKANFSDYTNKFRVESAKELITMQPEMNMAEVLYAVGFNSKSSFYTAFKKLTRLSPKEYQRQVLKK
ncbi:MAG: helix-turn-helix domain-containing protein [Cyclobacteriaceae bacterium]